MARTMTAEYLAGLFDGEGCIDVQVMYPKAGEGRLYVRPRVRMCMTNSARQMMELLHAAFGGHLVHRKAQKASQQDSWSLEWLSEDAIKEIIRTILPHLILKAEQAKLVLWWFANASGRQTKEAGFAGMEQARRAFKDELAAMKRDPQRLSERAAARIEALMRQSDHTGDRVTKGENTLALA